jgi:oligopeptide/dipeptide ABC transporter ATP-binding protein
MVNKPNEAILQVRGLTKHFNIAHGILAKPQMLQAVDDATFTVNRGETLGIVGESGSGKSTLGRMLLNLIEPTSGTAAFDGIELFPMDPAKEAILRRKMQMVFQDPYASLNPRLKIGAAIAEPIRANKVLSGRKQIEARVAELLDLVGLPPEAAHSYPHEFSGGQRQRVGIARALGVAPEFIVCDEVVSALDVSIQAQILNLLMDLQKEFGLTYLFVAHDLSVVEHVSDRVAVMYLGRLVEVAPTAELFYKPLHPYTEALMSAIPALDPDDVMKPVNLKGEIPSPANPPTGCPFHPRCPYVQDVCKQEMPALREYSPGHLAACHFADQLSLKGAAKS